MGITSPERSLLLMRHFVLQTSRQQRSQRFQTIPTQTPDLRQVVRLDEGFH